MPFNFKSIRLKTIVPHYNLLKTWWHRGRVPFCNYLFAFEPQDRDSFITFYSKCLFYDWSLYLVLASLFNGIFSLHEIQLIFGVITIFLKYVYTRFTCFCFYFFFFFFFYIILSSFYEFKLSTHRARVHPHESVSLWLRNDEYFACRLILIYCRSSFLFWNFYDCRKFTLTRMGFSSTKVTLAIKDASRNTANLAAGRVNHLTTGSRGERKG